MRQPLQPLDQAICNMQKLLLQMRWSAAGIMVHSPAGAGPKVPVSRIKWFNAQGALHQLLSQSDGTHEMFSGMPTMHGHQQPVPQRQEQTAVAQ